MLCFQLRACLHAICLSRIKMKLNLSVASTPVTGYTCAEVSASECICCAIAYAGTIARSSQPLAKCKKGVIEDRSFCQPNQAWPKCCASVLASDTKPSKGLEARQPTLAIEMSLSYVAFLI